MPRSSTGFSLLPDTGVLSYNGITFSALYTSELHGGVTQDDAKRTTKDVEWSLAVEGRVTLNPGEPNTDASWTALRRQLSAHGGALTYTGQGFGGLVVNQPGGLVKDIAFGPIPKILYFQPLGQGRSAMIRWQVSTRIPELAVIPTQSSLRTTTGPTSPGFGGGAGGGVLQNNIALPLPVLQYNYSAEITYDEEGYSHTSLKGVLEIPMTRKAVDNRTLPDIVDAYRSTWLDIQVDLTKFRVTDRSFEESRDKRTINWSFSYQELAPMSMPPDMTVARGNFSFRPAIHIPPFGIISDKLWYCTLKCTYVVRKDRPRETALWAFYAMLSFRMRCSVFGNNPGVDEQGNEAQQNANPNNNPPLLDAVSVVGLTPQGAAIQTAYAIGYFYNRITNAQTPVPAKDYNCAYLTDFTGEEGLYLDSKTVTFSASWLLACSFRTLIVATGFWHRPPDAGNTWATSIQDISGWRSWLANNVDPTVDVIVDMGGGSPPLSPPFGP